MSTPMIAGRTLGLVPVAARLTPANGTRGISLPSRRDPDHGIAWAEVRDQRSDYAEVTYPDGEALAFRAWRVSSESWAWQTSQMGAPAFQLYGVNRPNPRPVLADPTPEFAETVYGMPRAEWDAYGRTGA